MYMYVYMIHLLRYRSQPFMDLVHKINITSICIDKQLYRLLSIAVYIFLHPEGKDSIVHCTITNFPAASIFCISSMNAQENKIMQVET